MSEGPSRLQPLRNGQRSGPFDIPVTVSGGRTSKRRTAPDRTGALLRFHIEGGKSMSSTKVALVTGSGKRRVGWHVAEALAGRGYALAIHYRSSAAEAQETIAALESRRV